MSTITSFNINRRLIKLTHKTRHKMKKKTHKLHECRISEEFLREFNLNGINLPSIIKKYVKADANPGIQLIGSLADGLGNGASDLDINVLLDRKDQFIFNDDSINLNYNNRKEVLIYVNGIEINLIFYFYDRLNTLIGSFINIAPALYNPKDIKSFPILSEDDLQFLHQLKNGISLENPEVIETWKDECMVELLPTYLAVYNFLIAREILEDAFHEIGSTEGSSCYMAKIVLEHAISSVMGRNGFTNQNKKWLMHYLNRLEDSNSRELVSKGINLLFSPMLKSLADETQHIKKIQQLIDDIQGLLQKDIVIDKAISYLTKEINYIME
jgi:hypothetical protein